MLSNRLLYKLHAGAGQVPTAPMTRSQLTCTGPLSYCDRFTLFVEQSKLVRIHILGLGTRRLLRRNWEAREESFHFPEADPIEVFQILVMKVQTPL